ncbi:hypothetical protein FRB95_001771 [Tulasnella sp. JGI-2019a]|nr:hypothetical protein FRB95_001771 [Tulasnella sp. JGI-2019a]
MRTGGGRVLGIGPVRIAGEGGTSPRAYQSAILKSAKLPSALAVSSLMAYYAASSPPPPKAPSLAPTTVSGMTAQQSDSPQVEEKKKKVSHFLKRALKEVSGGGGNNAKFESEEALKGGPVLRPFGRGGVGAKAKSTKSSDDPNTLHKTGSKSPSSSSILSVSAAQHYQGQQVPPPNRFHDEGPASEYDNPTGLYAADDGESVVSSIPAPRRTQQWVEHLAGLPSPPHSHAGTPPAPPSLYGGSVQSSQHQHGIFPNSPPHTTYSYQPSQYSRTNSDPPYDSRPSASYRYHQDESQGGYPNPPSGSRARGLHSVDEHGNGSGGQFTPYFEEQFGRLGVDDRDSIQQRSSSTVSSPRGRPTNNARSGRLPAGQNVSRFTTGGDPNNLSADLYEDTRLSHPSSLPLTASSPQFIDHQQLAAQIVQRYTAAHGHPPSQSVLDQHLAAAARLGQNASASLSPPMPAVALQSHTRELQSKIEILKEQEREARERLDAIRRDGEARMRGSGSVPHVMERQASASSSEMARLKGVMDTGNRPLDHRQQLPTMAAERDAIAGTTSISPSHSQQSLIERERLRQQAMEREHHERDLVGQPSGMSYRYPSPPADPHSTMLQQPQQPQGRGPSAAPTPSIPTPTNNNTSGMYPGLDTQQQLIMQLGTLLVQQQQQLQILTAAAQASRMTSDPLSASTNVPAIPGAMLPSLGGLDMNALLALATLQQQQQQLSQAHSQVQAQASGHTPPQTAPTLVTSPPTDDHSDPQRDESPLSLSRLTPSPEATDSRSANSSFTRLDASLLSSNAEAKYREAMGMWSSDSIQYGTSSGSVSSTLRSSSARREPPRAPLPGPPNPADRFPGQSTPGLARRGSESTTGTPPPAYNRSAR